MQHLQARTGPPSNQGQVVHTGVIVVYNFLECIVLQYGLFITNVVCMFAYVVGLHAMYIGPYFFHVHHYLEHLYLFHQPAALSAQALCLSGTVGMYQT